MKKDLYGFRKPEMIPYLINYYYYYTIQQGKSDIKKALQSSFMTASRMHRVT